mmetsp:Transcript_29144/g.57923  ORF Transcript_29144/g.57923 Transcript_29144/m.57923 type:complete len:214 (-) Transcript_29144:357-998(-)
MDKTQLYRIFLDASSLRGDLVHTTCPVGRGVPPCLFLFRAFLFLPHRGKCARCSCAPTCPRPVGRRRRSVRAPLRAGPAPRPARPRRPLRIQDVGPPDNDRKTSSLPFFLCTKVRGIITLLHIFGRAAEAVLVTCEKSAGRSQRGAHFLISYPATRLLSSLPAKPRVTKVSASSPPGENFPALCSFFLWFLVPQTKSLWWTMHSCVIITRFYI